MPTRRSVLAAGGPLAVTALAGCSTISGRSTEGAPAQVQSAHDLFPDEGIPVAQASTQRLRCPEDDVELETTCYERTDGDLIALTRIDVFPGQQECDSDWTHDGVQVTHDWNQAGLAPPSINVVGHMSNVTQTTESATEEDGAVRLEHTMDSGQSAWHVWRTDTGGDVEQYFFRSRCAVGAAGDPPDASIDAGDTLLGVRAEVPLSTDGLLKWDTDTVVMARSLAYDPSVDSG